MRLGVLPCQGVKKCSVCGQEREGCITERAFIRPTCPPCVEQRNMHIAIGDDLEARLRACMTGWLDFWTAFIPIEEVAGSDFDLADGILQNLAAELLPGDLA